MQKPKSEQTKRIEKVHKSTKLLARKLEVIVPVDTEVEVTMELPEIEVHHITKCLPCEYCGKPVNPAELPVVLEWGKREPNQPPHLGRPWKRVAHLNCDRAARGVKVKEHKERPATEGSSKKASVSRSPRGSFSGQKIYRKIKNNPRKAGTHGFNSFSLIKDGMTYEQYIQAGGRQNDLRWDIEHGWVEVK